MDTKHTVITIGREYGSGGRETGELLAKELGIPFYDKEILNRAAKDSGICEAMFENHDERTMPSYLYSLSSGMAMGSDGAGLAMELPLNHRIFLAQFDAITKIAEEGPCVIVGRCADYVLKERRNTINVFLYAALPDRIARIMKKEGVDEGRAKELIRKTDKQRQSYYNFFAEGNWGVRCNYHLMLRTDAVSLADVAGIIAEYVRRHAN